MARAVIKRRGLGISPGYYERLPRLLSKKNKRKIEPKEIPSCLIPRTLVVFTPQLEILVTTLSGTSNMALLFFPHPLSFSRTSSCFPVNSVWASFRAWRLLSSPQGLGFFIKDAQTDWLACCLLRRVRVCVCVWAIIVNIPKV